MRTLNRIGRRRAVQPVKAAPSRRGRRRLTGRLDSLAITQGIDAITLGFLGDRPNDRPPNSIIPQHER